MNARAPLGRLMTAMLTPFDDDDAVDLAEAGRIARHLVAQGVESLVVGGTTGESPTLSNVEKLDLFGAVKAAVGPTVAVIAGTCNNDTRDSVALTREAERVGIDGILAVVPYYNKPPQDGMLRHFGAIAEATALPVVAYNVPGRTGANLLPATLLELARRHRNVVGVKESSGDLAQFTEILRDRQPGFRLWCGDDHLFLPALAIGADGLVSVAAHVCGAELRALLDAFRAGDVETAGATHRALAPLIAALFATTNPQPVKWAMNRLGFACGACRPPLGEMPPDVIARLAPLLAPYRDRVAPKRSRSPAYAEAPGAVHVR